MSIENDAGVHSKEMYKVDPKKSRAEQYAEAKELDYSKCDSDTYVDVSKRGKVTILQE